MRHTELIYALALKRQKGIGDIYARKLLLAFPSLYSIFDLKPLEISRRASIPITIASQIQLQPVLDSCMREAEWMQKNDIHYWLFSDPDYPSLLKECYDAPWILFYKGKISPNALKSISIVGTRHCSKYGVEMCQKLVSELAVLNPVIVSGFALGIDISAHRSALIHGLETWAVLAHGLDRFYPKSHAKYVDAILEQGGFITEFAFGEEPMAMHFVRRNRIVAGIAQATVVVESGDKGGSLITANLAYDYNREVFAIPGKITDPFSSGCHTLIKSQKAHLLTSAADLVYQLNWDLTTDRPSHQTKILFELTPLEEQIVQCLKNKSQHIDELAFGLKVSISELSPALLQLELQGGIRSLPGKYFELI